MRYSLIFILLFFFLLPICCFCQINSDVKIGSQIWQSKNLDVTTFSNGEKIFEAKSIKDWDDAFASKQPAWCYYNFNPENGKKYGKLYNMYAVMDSRGLAPFGYHIPSNKDFEILEKFIGSENAGKKLKSTNGWNNSKRWIPGKVKCTNCADWSAEFRRKIACNVCKDYKTVYSDFAKQVIFSGNGSDIFHFQALPSGQLRTKEFHELGKICVWWSLSDPNKKIGYFEVNSDFEALARNDYWTSSYPQTYSTYYGNSVRCIKDNLKRTSNKMQTFSTGTGGSEKNSNINNNIPAINPNRANSSQINVSISGWPPCVQNSRQKIIFIITDKNEMAVTYFKELADADDYLANNENKGYEVKKEACIFHYEDCDLDLQGPFSCEMYLRKNGTFVSSGDYKVGKWKCNERNRVQYYDVKLE
jgi:uncharacterized protein (TIGR02145 family)